METEQSVVSEKGVDNSQNHNTECIKQVRDTIKYDNILMNRILNVYIFV